MGAGAPDLKKLASRGQNELLKLDFWWFFGGVCYIFLEIIIIYFYSKTNISMTKSYEKWGGAGMNRNQKI